MIDLHTYGFTTSTDSTFESVTSVPLRQPTRTKRPVAVSVPIRNAVYSHIKAVRTLGRKSINTAEIAAALGLSQEEVAHAVRALKEKGVKVMGR